MARVSSGDLVVVVMGTSKNVMMGGAEGCILSAPGAPLLRSGGALFYYLLAFWFVYRSLPMI